MNIKILILLITLVSSSFTFAKEKSKEKKPMDVNSFACVGKENNRQTIKFSLNRTTFTITFSSTKGFEDLDIISKEALGVNHSLGESDYKLNFVYSAFNTANYELVFDKNLKDILDSKNVNMKLTGDDGDGGIVKDKEFSCKVK